MPVHTFSSKTKRPEDTQAVEDLKEHCEKRNLNFSAVVIELIKEYDCGRRDTKVSDRK